MSEPDLIPPDVWEEIRKAKNRRKGVKYNNKPLMEAGRITPGRYAWLLARGGKKVSGLPGQSGLPP